MQEIQPIFTAASRRVLKATLLTVGDVAELTNMTLTEIENFRQGSSLLGIPCDDQTYLYPEFQFDLEEPFKEHRLDFYAIYINGLMAAVENPWGVAAWWIDPNGYLNGGAPAEYLYTSRQEDVVRAAEIMVETTPSPGPGGGPALIM